MRSSSSQVPDNPSDPSRSITCMTQVCSSLPFSSSQDDISSTTHFAEMHTQIPTALTLAPVGSLVGPHDAFPQVSIPLLAPNFVPTAFSTQISEAATVSRRHGFGESTPPPNIGAASADPIFLGASPFVPLFLSPCYHALYRLLLLVPFPIFPLQFPLASCLQVKLLPTQTNTSNK